MSTARNLASFSGCLNIALLVFTFAFRTCRHGVRPELRLSERRNSGFLLFNAERVRALRALLFPLGGFELLNGVGELS